MLIYMALFKLYWTLGKQDIGILNKKNVMIWIKKFINNICVLGL